MRHRDLREFLAALDDDLIRVAEPFDPRYEIAAFLHEVQGRERPVLFENVVGYPGVRVIGNLLVSRRLLAQALDTTEERLAQTYLDRKQRALAPLRVDGAAPVQEVVHENPAELLSLMPILTHYAGDAAPYITSGLVLAKDPRTGRRAMGVHRLVVQGGNRLSVSLTKPPLTVLHRAAETQGQPLEVAVALGVEPATLLASVVKVGATGPDKMEIAGALQDAPMELACALTVALEVPARAEAIIEGRVLPGVRQTEGPFGESTGYYFSKKSPVIEVTAVTHRRHLVYMGLCPWSADVDQLLSLSAGTELLGQLQDKFYGVTDVEMMAGTCGFSAVVAVHDCPPTEVRRLIHFALALDRRLKVLTVVDDEIDIRNPREVSWAMATRFQPARDSVVMEGFEGYVIDPSAQGRNVGSKIGFDATRSPGTAYEKVTFQEAALAKAQRVLYQGTFVRR